MRSRTKRPIWRFLKKHLISILLITSLIIASGLLIFFYNQSVTSEVARNDKEIAQLAKEAKEIRELKEKRLAEEKIAQEAAAKQAAEQAKTSGSSGADTIDSKVCNSSHTHSVPSSIDVVVNKKHCIQPLGYSPSDLVTVNGATLSAQAADAFSQMMAAASAAGQPFYVTSSFRSYATQVSTYNYWISVSGQAGADTYSARPGYSEHQTGLAFDVAANGCVLDCFGSTSQYAWLQQNAANFGFIQRYYSGFEAITGYKAEEWHYRYVGTATAKDMQAKGIKTLEQYWNIAGGDY